MDSGVPETALKRQLVAQEQKPTTEHTFVSNLSKTAQNSLDNLRDAVIGGSGHVAAVDADDEVALVQT